MDVKNALVKAEAFLKGAKITLAAELGEICVIACYYAVFWAAIAMLHYVGIKQRRWEHGDLKEKFGLECVGRRKLCPPEFGRWIGELYDLRKCMNSNPLRLKLRREPLEKQTLLFNMQRRYVFHEAQKIKEGTAPTY